MEQQKRERLSDSQNPIKQLAKNLRSNLALKVITGTGIVLVTTLGILFYFLVHQQEKLIFKQIENEVKLIFKQVVITRRWIADHGGIFVERLPWVKPNPYLSDKGAEIEDVKGTRYVRENPAMVTKNLSRYAREKGLFWFHITSMKLVNPDNAPDDFEKESLMLFEKGNASERSRIETIENLRHFRYIAPLYVEPACLNCHAKQGYRVGDVRGAISVTLPIEDVLAVLKGNRINMFLAGIITASVIMAVLYLMMRRMVLSPIHRLNSSIKGFASGSYPPGQDIKTGDELEDLGRSFSGMAQDLSEYHNCMEDRIKSAVKNLEDTNKKLTEANEQLMDMNRKKSDFVAKVSHELRTPLTSIKGAMDYVSVRLQSIISDVDIIQSKEELRKLDDLLMFFEVIKKNAERLIRMVNDILDLERIEQGISEMHFTEVDMSVVINEVVTSLKSSAMHKGINILIEISDNLLISADEDRMRQVIINLLSNAIKYSPVNSTINIKAVSKDNCLEVIVKDNGPGISLEEQDRIFERFYTIGDNKGTGLGLSISKGIIETHGGIIGITSDGMNGSSFFFKLPQTTTVVNAG